MAQAFMRLPEVRKRTGLGDSSIYRGIKSGTFPPSVPIGKRAVAWIEADIERWIQARIDAAKTDPPRPPAVKRKRKAKAPVEAGSSNEGDHL